MSLVYLIYNERARERKKGKKRIEYNVNSWWCSLCTVHLFKWAFTSINLFISFLFLTWQKEEEEETCKRRFQFNWIKTIDRDKIILSKRKNIELIVALRVTCAWGNLLSFSLLKITDTCININVCSLVDEKNVQPIGRDLFSLQVNFFFSFSHI